MSDKLKARLDKAVLELEKFLDDNCAYAMNDKGQHVKALLKEEHLAQITMHMKRIRHFRDRVSMKDFNEKYWTEDQYLTRRKNNAQHFGIKQ